jgi:hypothetical protein
MGDFMKTKLKTLFTALCASTALGVSVSAIPVFQCRKIDPRKSWIHFIIRENEEGKNLPDIFDIFIDGERTAPLFQKKYISAVEGKPIQSVDMLVPYGNRSRTISARTSDSECHFCDVFGGKENPIFFIRDVHRRQEEKKDAKCPRQKPNCWLIMDRKTQADDNAEHFYRWMRHNHPKIQVTFALNHTSPHWNRLQKEGFALVAIDGESSAYTSAFRRASKVISSQCGEYRTDACYPHLLHFKDFVFLQHGVIENDMSFYLNGRILDLFVTSTNEEYKFIFPRNAPYKTFSCQGVCSGLPRHDALLRKAQQSAGHHRPSILIMPTWRRYIFGNGYTQEQRTKLMEEMRDYPQSQAGNLDTRVGMHGDADDPAQRFWRSEYFRAWDKFLNSQELRELSERYGYRVLFFPHALTTPFLQDWELPEHIEKVTCFDRSIQDVFAESDLMITDYSSVAFEMAYIQRPIIYFQFDEKTFRETHYKEGYFDYRRDGFGPVVTHPKALFTELERSLQQRCQPAPEYLQRMQTTFPFRDGMCCERVYRAICALDESRKPEDFDREVWIDYAQHAEDERDIDFARRCWERLAEYGDESQKGLAQEHLSRL